MPRKPKDDVKATMSVGGGPEIELTGDVAKDAAAIAPHLSGMLGALAGSGLMRSYDSRLEALTNELVLGIDDAEFGPRIRETRIHPPAERTTEFRIDRLRAAMEKVGALGDNPAGERNRSRLRALVDEPGKLHELEIDFLVDADRTRNGEWMWPENFAVLPEAVEITTFVMATYRRDLIGQRIAVVVAKDIPPVNRRHRHGTMAKLPGKMRYIAQYDALMTINWPSWVHLTDTDRQRLVHHELLHLELGDKRQLQMRAHDFEDFADCVDIYGLHSETKLFPTDGHVGDVLRNASAQLELLSRAG